MICRLLCYLLSQSLTVRRSIPLTLRFRSALASAILSANPVLTSLLFSIISPLSSYLLPYTSAIINLVDILGMLVR